MTTNGERRDVGRLQSTSARGPTLPSPRTYNRARPAVALGAALSDLSETELGTEPISPRCGRREPFSGSGKNLARTATFAGVDLGWDYSPGDGAGIDADLCAHVNAAQE